MTIRWIFFFNEGNVKSDVKDDAEDARIKDFMATNPQGVLALPGDNMDLRVNLALVKCIARKVLSQAEIDAELAASAPESEAVAPSEVVDCG